MLIQPIITNYREYRYNDIWKKENGGLARDNKQPKIKEKINQNI